MRERDTETHTGSAAVLRVHPAASQLKFLVIHEHKSSGVQGAGCSGHHV